MMGNMVAARKPVACKAAVVWLRATSCLPNPIRTPCTHGHLDAAAHVYTLAFASGRAACAVAAGIAPRPALRRVPAEASSCCGDGAAAEAAETPTSASGQAARQKKRSEEGIAAAARCMVTRVHDCCCKPPAWTEVQLPGCGIETSLVHTIGTMPLAPGVCCGKKLTQSRCQRRC
eukprot:2077-Chlamydomonas_euryale.AAC.10